jgi:replicative DNA helicase
MDAVDHGRVVLGVIFASGSLKALDYAVARVPPEYFADRVQRQLFVLAQRYADQTRGLLPRHVLDDLLREQPPGTVALYGEYYDSLAKQAPIPPDQFRHSVLQLRELHTIQETAEALAQAQQIFRDSAKDAKGKELRGAADARAYALAALADIDREAAGTDTPEGDIRHETHDVLALYAKAQEQRLLGISSSILTGIQEIDDALKGSFLSRGELGLVVGDTSAGKTGWCCSLAWDASVRQGKNTVILTTETLRPQVRTRIIARHSRMAQFSLDMGLPKGLNTRDIRTGALSEQEMHSFTSALKDFDSNPDYGRCYVVQVPRGATVPVLEARLNSISRQFIPDMVIIDYLQLLRSTRTRQSAREELSEIVKDIKQVAATFMDGMGVPILSPWQVSRKGKEDAKTTGGYGVEALSETSEAGNTPDVIVSLLAPLKDETFGRAVPLEFSVMKNRDGARGQTVRLQADFANAFFEVQPQDVSAGSSDLFGSDFT